MKKLLLFGLIQMKNESFGTMGTFTSKILFTSDTLKPHQEKEIFYENYLYKIICNELSTYDKYKFYKSFQINAIPEGLQQVNIGNKIIDLDHDNYYYFEIININKNLINAYNKMIFQNYIKDKKVKPLEDNLINIEFTKKIYNILSMGSLKTEFIGDLEAASLFRIKKSLLKDKFKKKEFIYAIESVQNGEKDKIDNKCMINSLKDCFIGYYYELKQYNNKEILNNYYETLLMFYNFLNSLDKYLDNTSEKEKEQFKIFILNPENNMNTILFMQEMVPNIIQNIFIEKVTIKKDLTDEDFNEIMSKALNQFESILRKQNDKSGTNTLLVVFLSIIFNSILLRNNEVEHLIPYLTTITMNHKVFNLSRMNLNLIMYMMMHIQYIYFSFDENHIKNYKKFAMDWYEKFDKNSVNKTFNETKYKLLKK